MFFAFLLKNKFRFIIFLCICGGLLFLLRGSKFFSLITSTTKEIVSNNKIQTSPTPTPIKGSPSPHFEKEPIPVNSVSELSTQKKAPTTLISQAILPMG